MARLLTDKLTPRCRKTRSSAPEKFGKLPKLPNLKVPKVPKKDDIDYKSTRKPDDKGVLMYHCEGAIGCRKTFVRRADFQRHFRTVHLKLRESVCVICGKEFAQPTTLKSHMNSHCTELEKQKPHCCYMSKRNGTPCTKRFSDPSSLARHLKEQHKGSTYQCPIPGCVDRANKPKCIKRSSEFKKHLSKKHGVVMEDVDQFSVTTWSDETSLVPVSPKPRKRKSAKRDAASVPTEPTLVFVEEPLPMATPSPAPPYSAVPYAGEIPLLCVPSDDGYASTPGMTYASPSPAPSMPEIVYDMGSEESACPPSYTTLDGYGNVVQDPFPQKDMSTYQVDNALGIGLMLSDSDLNNDSYARGLNYLSYNDMLPLTDMNMAASYGQMSMPCENFAQKTYMDPALSMYSSQCAFDFAPALESSGQADYFAGYSAWDLAVPEQSYAPQTNAIIPPSLPTFMTSNLGMFTTE